MRQNVVRKFNDLSLDKKSKLVSNYGKWIWFTDAMGCRISVFEIEGELVEVWYNLAEHVIEGIRIPTYEELDIHLENIDLPLRRRK